MNELITWLRAQLDEEERTAREAPGPKWVVGIERMGEPGRWFGAGAYLVALPDPWLSEAVSGEVLRATVVDGNVRDAERSVGHAVRWDPARALAEVAAKRRVIDLCDDWSGEPRLSDVLRLLALPYADREGYREEWAPEAA